MQWKIKRYEKDTKWNHLKLVLIGNKIINKLNIKWIQIKIILKNRLFIFNRYVFYFNMNLSFKKNIAYFKNNLEKH